MDISIYEQLSDQISLTDGRQTVVLSNRTCMALYVAMMEKTEFLRPRWEELVWYPRHRVITEEQLNDPTRWIPTRTTHYSVAQVLIVESTERPETLMRIVADLPAIGRTGKTLRWDRESLVRALRAACVAIRLRQACEVNGPVTI